MPPLTRKGFLRATTHGEPMLIEPPDDRAVQRDENLDVVRTSRDQEELQLEGSAGESSPDPHLICCLPFPGTG
jgi:hypothetical protein